MRWRKAAALLAGVCALGACDFLSKREANTAEPDGNAIANVAEGERGVDDATGRRLCASGATYERLKMLAFEEARRVRGLDARPLDAISRASVVRMERPVVLSRDEGLGVTVCSGRFVLELPPGAAPAFGGHQRLVADIEYSAQEAADGSGPVFQISGAEPIVFRLAAFGGVPRAPGTAVAQAVDPWWEQRVAGHAFLTSLKARATIPRLVAGGTSAMYPSVPASTTAPRSVSAAGSGSVGS